MDAENDSWPRRRFVGAGVALLAGVGVLPAGLGAATHTVKRGDTLGEIAARYGVTVGEIKRANSLSSDVIRIGQTLDIPEPGPRTTLRYTVQRGDTLSEIARRNGISVADLKHANGLRGDTIQIGQTLVIPGASSAPDLLAGVRRLNAQVRVNRGRWNTIVVHHSAIKNGNAASYGRYHKEKRGMQNGLAYHFVIGNGIDSGDGEIEVGPRWMKQLQGGHVRSHAVNQTGIGICLVGNFMETRPTSRQMQAFTQLMDWLRGDILRSRPRFAGHKEIDGPRHTVCPGKYFPLAAMHRRYD